MFRFFDWLTKSFWSMFDFVSSVRLAKSVKSGSESQDSNIYFGLHAIYCGVAMLVMSVFVGLLLLYHVFSLNTINLALGIAVAVVDGLLLAHTIKNMALQYYLNKSKTSLIYFGVALFCMLASVAILLVFAFAI